MPDSLIPAEYVDTASGGETSATARTDRNTSFKMDVGEGFVLTVVRAWTMVRGAGKENEAIRHRNLNIWHRSFCLIGGVQAAQHLDMFLAILSRKAKVRVELGCSRCGAVSADEGHLLATLQYLQQGQAVYARSALEKWLEGEDLNHALHHALLLMDALNGHGIVLGGQKFQ